MGRFIVVKQRHYDYSRDLDESEDWYKNFNHKFIMCEMSLILKT